MYYKIYNPAALKLGKIKIKKKFIRSQSRPQDIHFCKGFDNF